MSARPRPQRDELPAPSPARPVLHRVHRRSVRPATLAVDLGGTRVKWGVLRDGSLVEPMQVRAAPHDLDDALLMLGELIGRCGADAVAVATPGNVDAAGRVISLPGKHRGLEGFALAGWLRERVADAVVVNDALAYALGEASAGDVGPVLVVTVGTGIGTAVVEVAGPVVSSPFGNGVLGGAAALSDDDPRYLDTSGKPGTFEAGCRAQRIVDYAHDAGLAAETVPHVFDAWRRGDPRAHSALTRYRGLLARGLASLATAHGAGTVVLGGGPALPDGPLWVGLGTLLRERLWPGHAVKLRAAAHGDAAALIGLDRLLRRRP
ncbi:MAG TPA: ROK family protein [Mycobacteriales bacterium]|nr:ROK family protein [Mycobacteriales bacterium]